MTLLSPWALLGLVAIAGPVAAHLLARKPPKRLRFPNLRFLPQTPPTPVKRNRLADLGLLALRVGIIASAAFALAGLKFAGPAGSAGSTGDSGSAGAPSAARSAVSSGSPVATTIAADRELTILAGVAERAGADAALAAAVRQGAPSRIARSIAVVFTGFEKRDALLTNSMPLSQPWMSDVFAAVAADPLVEAAATRLARRPLDVVRVATDRADTGRLLMFIDAPPHSLLAAATISALLRCASAAVATAVVASPAVADNAVSSETEGSTDARWVWILVAVLLIAETLVRRRRPALQQQEHARVA